MPQLSPLAEEFLLAYEAAPTVEEGLSQAIHVLARHIAPSCDQVPDDMDLEEWARYALRNTLRRRLHALAAELIQDPVPSGESGPRDLSGLPAVP